MKKIIYLFLSSFILSGFVWRGTGTVFTPTGTVSTESFFNANSSTVTGPIPVMSGIWLPPGAVPQHNHLVPYVGGVPLTQWEIVSEASLWPDNSYRGGSFSGFLPSSLAAGARQQIIWKVVAGDPPGITAANPNVISSNSNFHVDLTDVTSAYWKPNNGGSNQTVAALMGPVVTPGSGIVSAVQVRFPTSQGYGCGGTTTNCGGYTQTISGCSSAPTFSFISPGTGLNPVTGAVVTSAGSGCPTIGSGTFTFNVNNILAGVGSSVPLCSDQTVNSQVCQYSGSNVKNAFKVWGYFLDSANTSWSQNTSFTSGEVINSNGNSYTAGANCTSASSGIGPVGLSTWSTYPNIVPITDGTCSWTPVIGKETATAEIEVWKNSSGGFYGINIAVLIDNAVYVANGTLTPWTFNADLYDGSLDLRGSANDSSYIGITQYGDASGTCLCDNQSLPFWDIGNSTAQSTTLNQVIFSPSTSDKTYFHANHALPPIQKVPTITTNLTLPRNNAAHLQQQPNDFSIAVPFCMCDLDSQSGLGSSASHAWDSAVDDAYTAWWQVEDTVSDGGWSWLGDIRNGGVATQVAYGGPREPLTGHPTNWIPTAAYTPPTNFTDPVRPRAEFFCSGGGFDMICNSNYWSGYTGNVSHYPGHEAGIAYILEARRYMFDIVVRNAIAEDIQNGTQYDRASTFGGTTYYTEANANEIRTASWYQYAISWAAVFDAKESEGTFFTKEMNDSFAMQHALYSFVGSGTTGWGNNPFAKCSDWTSGGYEMFPHALLGVVCGSVASGGGNPGGSSLFMSGYQAMVYEMNTMWLNGSNSDLTAIDNLYIGTALLGIANNCLFLATPYTIPYLTNVYNQTEVTGWDNTTLNAAFGELPNLYARLGNLLAWSAGNSTFTVGVTPSVNENWSTYPTAAATSTTLLLHNSVGILGGQVYDTTTPANVPVDTYVTGSAPNTTITVNQPVNIPAPVTTTVVTAPTSGGTTLVVASAAGISPGSVVVDITTPTAFPSSNSVDRTQFNNTVNTITSGTTLNFLYSTSTVTFTCPAHCPAVGDTLEFMDLLTFSQRMDYPDPSPSAEFPTVVGTPLPSGSQVCLTNFSAQGEFVPAPNVGTYPPTTSAGGTLTEGQCFVWNQVGASGTAGTLTTLSTATPPNTIVVPSSTGSGGFSFRPNVSCPAPSVGTLSNGAADYHNPGYRLAEEFAWANFALALGINPTLAASDITNLSQSQTPLNTVYGPSAGGPTEQKWLLDSSF